jgi:hypothetical protein
LLLGLGLCLFGCEKKESPPAANTGAVATPTSTPAATSAVAANAGNPDDGEGIPTEEDFEDEAEQKITSQNADAELDKLEKEISN